MQRKTFEMVALQGSPPIDAAQRAPQVVPRVFVQVLPFGLLSALLGLGVGLCAAGLGIAIMAANYAIPYLMGVGGLVAGATFPYILASRHAERTVR